MEMNLNKLWEMVKDKEAWHAMVHGVTKSRTQLSTFELLCWKRLLRVPWTARRLNQSILKEISPGI